MAYRFFNPVPTFFHAGAVLDGGKLFFYEPGTLTPKNTYQDEELSIPNTNPIVLGPSGRPQVDTFLDGDYRVVLKSADESITIFDRDPYRETASAADVQSSAFTWGGTAGGTNNALTISPDPAIAGYESGQEFFFVVAATNTGATTLNVNGNGAKSVTKDGSKALAAGDLEVGQVAFVKYDGTRFQLMSGNQNSDHDRADVASAATVDLNAVGRYARITGTTTITAVTLENGRAAQVVFADALVLTHNASSLILPGGANITTAAGDTATIVGESGGVRVHMFNRAAARSSLTATRYYTSNDTWSKPSSIDFVIVEVVGGGGGGGGVGGATDARAGAGGGGGGYSRKKISSASLGATETVTVGAGGTAGGAGGGNGGAGGTSSFGSHCSATGGSGGAGTSTVALTAGGSGGAGSSGDLNTSGSPGSGSFISATDALSGAGGASFYGGGGKNLIASGTGNAGGNYGGGGSGGVEIGNPADVAGGAGAGGLVVVYEYSI